MRFERNQSERGAAVFVVVMAITLLTAVGLFAAHSATLVDQASGYARLARQTQSVAEYGTLTAAAELSTGASGAYVEQLTKSGDLCRANTGLSGTPPCYKLFADQLDKRTYALTSRHLIESTAGDGTPGSFGKDATTVGDFVVELTDPGPVSRAAAGTDIGGTGTSFRYLKVTATTTAQVRSSAAACVDQVTTTVGQQSVRAHLVIGPLRQ
jgi:hypothetical protein